MSSTPPDPQHTLALLRLALEQLRQLAAQPSADPVYARVAEQVAATVSALQSPTPTDGGVLPHPPSPG